MDTFSDPNQKLEIEKFIFRNNFLKYQITNTDACNNLLIK